MSFKDNETKLKVWWIPQVPGEMFFVSVGSVAEGVKIMDVLAEYDLFQLENRIKPDYCNAGGLLMLDTDDKDDGPEGSWVDWCDEETGEDDPRVWLESASAEGQS